MENDIFSNKCFDPYRNLFDVSHHLAWIQMYDSEKEKEAPDTELLNILKELILNGSSESHFERV